MSVKKLFEITGKIALITGATRGLGLQMAEALGEMGCRLAITARKKDGLEAAKTHLSKLGFEVLTLAGDLLVSDTIPSIVDSVLAKYGKIDILVNNAGTSWISPAEDFPLEAWNKLLNLNVTATFLLSQVVGKRAMIPGMAGKIINIASIAGLTGGPLSMPGVAYRSSKAAVINLTRSLATEWGKYNICVNAICPGFFPSKMSSDFLDVDGNRFIDATPLHRLGGEEDLKGVTVFLASDASRHITGQYIAVDGGVCSSW